MHRIHPVTEEACRPFYGSPVCAITNDGAQHIGILSRIRGGKLILNEQGTAGFRPESAGKKRKHAKMQSIQSPGGTEIPDFGFADPRAVHPLFRETLTIDLASVALLFLLPL